LCICRSAVTFHGHTKVSLTEEEKMRKSISLLILILPLLGLSIFCQYQVERRFEFPLPSIVKVKPSSFIYFWGSLLGLRRLSSDLAWIRLLQYYGSLEKKGEHIHHPHPHEGEEEHIHHTHHHRRGEYEDLLPMCQEVVRLDPYFHYAYLFGGGCLAFNHERYDEAIELLQEGIKNNPKFWRFRLYIAAIVYTKTKEYDKVVPLLAEAIRYRDCPEVVKIFLASIYKVKGEFGKAIAIWEHILATSRSEWARAEAESHLEEMEIPR
jgi:tetratricopeptide (TPR) repeat protein